MYRAGLTSSSTLEIYAATLVDASLIKADAHRKRGFPGEEGIEWERPGRKTRAVREYLDALDNDSEAVKADEATRKTVSLTDPTARWTAAQGGPAYYAYSTNYLIDVEAGVILDVEPSPSTLSEEAQAARAMIEHTEKRFGLKPKRFIGDTAYGNAQMLGWLVDEKQITPHVPVLDKSEGKEELFGASAFTWNKDDDCYVCPAGHPLRSRQRQFKDRPSMVTKDNTIIYRASKTQCDSCRLKPKCCPTTPIRKIQRSIHEEARELARQLARKSHQRN